MPASLSTTSSTKDIYVAPSSLPIYSSQIRPPMPSSLTTSTPSTTYQAPSSISVPPSAATSFGGSTATKAVTFGGLSSFPATTNNDASSSSDSDDSQKQKRRRHRKR